MSERNHWRDPVKLNRRARKLHARQTGRERRESTGSDPFDASKLEAIYQKTPLRKSWDPRATGSEIRLLQLSPATNPKAKLCGELEVVSLDDKNKYEALSYTWDAPEYGQVLEAATLRISGTSCQITGNLSSALKRLRYRDRPRTLWVDAVCIDQANNAERSDQIHIMATIYAGATEVVAWLGEQSQHTRPAFALASSHSVLSHLSRSQALDRQLIEKALNKRWSTQEARMRPWEEIVANRRYFRRRWVLQELAWASQIRFVCGQDGIMYEQLLAYVDWHQRSSLAGLTGPSHWTQFLHDLRSIRQRLQSYSGNGILHLLYAFQDSSCKDDRDRIAALISLCRGSLGGFTMNYDLPCGALYTNFTSSLIEDRFGRSRAIEKDFWDEEDVQNSVNPFEVDYVPHILQAAAFQASQRQEQDSHMPSWVPDWRLKVPKPAACVSWCPERCMQCPQFKKSSFQPLGPRILQATLPFYGQVCNGKWSPYKGLYSRELQEVFSDVPLPVGILDGDYVCGPTWSDRAISEKNVEGIRLVLRATNDGYFTVAGACPVYLLRTVGSAAHTVEMFKIV